MRRKTNESILSTSDIKNVFRTAVSMNNKPSIFGGLKKDKIELDDLHKAWREAGTPDDTEDIAVILRDKFGFSAKEIKKAYSAVFDSGDSDEDGHIVSPAVQKMADYAKEHGLSDALKAFIEKEYGQKLGLTQKQGMLDKLKGYLGKKAMAEDVMKIFQTILPEERSDRFNVIREQEQKQLGRTRK